jgi:hypothetical protein
VVVVVISRVSFRLLAENGNVCYVLLMMLFVALDDVLENLFFECFLFKENYVVVMKLFV